MVRQTVRYLKTLERAEATKESEETLEVVELRKAAVNEQDVAQRTEGENQVEEEVGDLDPEQVRQGREEEMNYKFNTLGMFEFGSWQEATSKVGKAPTATNWIE